MKVCTRLGKLVVLLAVAGPRPSYLTFAAFVSVQYDFSIKSVNTTFFEEQVLEWQETFCAEEPVQALRGWLLQRIFEDSQVDDYINCYESLYWIVQEERFDLGEDGSVKSAEVVAWNSYDQEMVLACFRS